MFGKLCPGLGCALGFVSFALSGAPDLELNPLSGYLESVDTDPLAGHLVRHVEDPGQGGGRSSALISDSASLDSRIAIRSTGFSWVVWWTDSATDDVRWARRDPETKEWTDEAVLSGAGDQARNPEIVHNGDDTWIAYEDHGTTAVEILIAGMIDDDPTPFDTVESIASTTFTGDVDVLVHSEQGHVWVTWVHSSTHVGWSEYDYAAESWGTVDYESYADGVHKARGRIRTDVLGN